MRLIHDELARETQAIEIELLLRRQRARRLAVAVHSARGAELVVRRGFRRVVRTPTE
jgi:hypothetical protein